MRDKMERFRHVFCNESSGIRDAPKEGGLLTSFIPKCRLARKRCSDGPDQRVDGADTVRTEVGNPDFGQAAIVGIEEIV